MRKITNANSTVPILDFHVTIYDSRYKIKDTYPSKSQGVVNHMNFLL